ncbi:hypothetical protein PVAP13_3NG066402 [Panicum virgatum]|uniref:Secreted protein n=1 Tax=Panicum virgatum TaxID=38727 RepID=A0A8T0U593_PANVG|nr:hypothetical protein PVAP13_3NG066402 [Panicum virgatum]
MMIAHKHGSLFLSRFSSALKICDSALLLKGLCTCTIREHTNMIQCSASSDGCPWFDQRNCFLCPYIVLFRVCIYGTCSMILNKAFRKAVRHGPDTQVVLKYIY